MASLSQAITCCVELNAVICRETGEQSGAVERVSHKEESIATVR